MQWVKANRWEREGNQFSSTGTDAIVGSTGTQPGSVHFLLRQGAREEKTGKERDSRVSATIVGNLGTQQDSARIPQREGARTEREKGRDSMRHRGEILEDGEDGILMRQGILLRMRELSWEGQRRSA